MTMTLASIAALPLIGEGNFRRVYRDGPYVYKLEYGEGVDLAANFCENRNIARLDGLLPNRVFIPDTDLLCIQGEAVIRMAYVPGMLTGECFCLPAEPCKPDCMPPNIVDALYDIGVTDLAYGNVIVNGLGYFIVDLDSDLE